MKELIKKDLLTIWAYWKYMLVIYVMIIGSAGYLGGTSGTLLAVLGSLVFSCVHNVIAVEENSRWNVLQCTFPTGRLRTVSAKYLLLFVCAGSMTLLLVLAFAVASLIRTGHIEWALLALPLLTLSTTLLCGAVQLPVIFALGVSHSNLLYVIMLMVITIGSTVLSNQLPFAGSVDSSVLSAPAVLTVLSAVALLLIAVSYVLSCFFYRRRELA